MITDMIHSPRHKICNYVCVWEWRIELSTRCTFEHFLLSACEAVFCQFPSPAVVECPGPRGARIFWCRVTWWRGRGTRATPPCPAWWRCTAPRSSARPWHRRCWPWPSCPPPAPASCPPRTLPEDWTGDQRSWTSVENRATVGRSAKKKKYFLQYLMILISCTYQK